MNSDPWVPISQRITPIPGRNGDSTHNQITSEQYIASLESKLRKLKGTRSSKEPTSKEMIQSLNTVKKQHMHHLVANTEDNYVSDYIEDDVNQGSNNTFIQRKIHPEKQALNAEELQILIDNDVLTKEQLKDEQLQCDPENSEKKTDLETQISETDAAR